MHHFYSILSFCVCRPIFLHVLLFLPQSWTHGTASRTHATVATVHASQPGDCEHGGNTPLTIHTVNDLYF